VNNASPQVISSAPPAHATRVRVDGKFFRCGETKFHVKGITYGPFAPNADGEHFASAEQTARDFQQIRELGANVVRVYYVPPLWFLNLAAEHQLKVFVDVPWPKHLCFLDSADAREHARETVRHAVRSCGGHPAVFAFSVVNEISAEIVRWSGVRRVQDFIDELVWDAKKIDPDCLCTFTSFPPTEFLHSEAIDFVCFNVYLHNKKPFADYLARLQSLAGEKPLMLGELGMDSIREGETHKCEFLEWQIETAFRGGLAGMVVFSFTDDWFRGGMQIEDWGFGLTTRDRRPKDSFRMVQRQYQIAPHFPLPRTPKVSVVVATYNGSRTLGFCLKSLGQLNYPDYEVIVVDDGSRDRVPEIVREFPRVRYIRQENKGLSVARNTGIQASTGEIVAFTDDDCRADEDWLYYIVGDLLDSDFAGIGGHNFLPPEDSCVAAAVMASPGGPAHVMLTDRLAEHIPGCNMVFYKWALLQVGMFDPIYRKAGDDVDLCWRLQDSQLRIGFSHAGFVWHYRRSTVKAYLKQQAGYGEAEALLISHHPEHFNSIGGSIWHGHIYAPAYSGLLLRGPVIYHGIFGSGLFQRIYAADPVQPLMLCTALGYHVFINLPLILLAFYFDAFKVLAFASFGISAGTCALAAIQANLPRNKHRVWSRPLIGLLFFLQPFVRGMARFKWRLNLLSGRRQLLRTLTPIDSEPPETVVYWCKGDRSRYQFLSGILAQLENSGWTPQTDSGWDNFDLDIPVALWTRLKLTTVTEELEQGRLTFRCRIEGRWSLGAGLVFILVTSGLLAALILLAAAWPWAWMGLILLPLLLWKFEDDRLAAQHALLEVIDAVAQQQQLIAIPAATRPSSPAASDTETTNPLVAPAS
jgi:glycosyltransferase involved in cell wall biosynthesis